MKTCKYPYQDLHRVNVDRLQLSFLGDDLRHAYFSINLESSHEEPTTQRVAP
jgi:hypothetical protein